ncbi:5-hydroxytryptamine receptor 3A-like [Solea solea]|uniref:5-hydroxytryptamine receptor 3A-like n=1 Tax=Solea solea TaxID=90069 RepID=UPI00272D21DD|nr:5-hydroxytryptamine receptor 3A-like [Solea solea]
MSGRKALAVLAVMAAAAAAAAGVSSSQTSDCSYIGILKHLNVMKPNDALMIRPVVNWKRPTIVLLDMLLYGIVDLGEKTQTVTSHIWIHLRWRDEFLTWNSSDFCGIDKVVIPRSKLWQPDIGILEDISDTGSIQQSPMVKVTSDGLVTAQGRQRLTSTCELDLYLFPFDTQNCNISFSSVNYNVEEIQLGTMNSDEILTSVSEALMITAGEWELVNLTILAYSSKKSDGFQSCLAYTVTLVRKPMLYVINLLVPMLYFLMLDLATFFIRDEKLNFKVTIVLSISVLLLILKDMLPSTENYMPLIANYSVTVFIMVGLSLLEAMLVDFLMGLDDYCAQRTRRSINTQVEIQLEANGHTEPVEAGEKSQVKPMTRPREGDLLKLILEEVKAARQETGRQCKEESKPGCYARLAVIIDYVYFVLYAITVVIYLTLMYVNWIGGVCLSAISKCSNQQYI